MSASYVEPIGNGFRVTGTRVSLDSVVHAFRNGQSAEDVASAYPALSLEQVYGAIAYYLAHREAVDESLEQSAAKFDALRSESLQRNADLHQRMAALRQAEAAGR